MIKGGARAPFFFVWGVRGAEPHRIATHRASRGGEATPPDPIKPLGGSGGEAHRIAERPLASERSEEAKTPACFAWQQD